MSWTRFAMRVSHIIDDSEPPAWPDTLGPSTARSTRPTYFFPRPCLRRIAPQSGTSRDLQIRFRSKGGHKRDRRLFAGATETKGTLRKNDEMDRLPPPAFTA